MSIRILAQKPDAPVWSLTPSSAGFWYSIATSADGSKLAIAGRGDDEGVFVSTNSGASWTKTAAPTNDWRALVSSSNGVWLVAAAWTTAEEEGNFGQGAIYTSLDGGATWKKTSAPGFHWSSLAASEDGTRLLAACEWGGIFRSPDSGTNWFQTTAPTNRYTYALASSANGSTLAAASEAIYLSKDGGLTWKKSSAPEADWTSITLSADGSRMAATAAGDDSEQNLSIYLSYDSGETWMRATVPRRPWQGIACSRDGTHLVAVTPASPHLDWGGEIFSSIDGGSTWIQNSAPALSWRKVVSSADGSKMAALALDFTAPGGTPSPHGVYTLGTAYKPWIENEPVSHVVLHGSSVSFQVRVEGGFLKYQWLKNGTNLLDGNSVFGSKSSSLFLTNVSPFDEGKYSVIATNSLGSVTSATVSLQLADWSSALAPNTEWIAVAASSDCQNLAAVGRHGFPGLAYSVALSGDAGATWRMRNPATNVTWNSVDMSADGTRIIVSGYQTFSADGQFSEGFLYISTNSGLSWKEGPQGRWSSVSCSADGNRFFAIKDRAVYISIDLGNNWRKTDVPEWYWNEVASSADGMKLAVAGTGAGLFYPTAGPICTSQDGGETWKQSGAPMDYWASIASSADGLKLAAATDSFYSWDSAGSIYLSSDAGATWVKAKAPENRWLQVSSSADGNKLVAIAGRDEKENPGAVYFSSDAGLSWSLAGAPDAGWSSVAISQDGTRLAGSSWDRGVWVSPSLNDERSTLRIQHHTQGILISWRRSETGLILQQSTNLLPGSWSTVDSVPANIGNWNILSQPSTPGSTFYRLIKN